MPRMGRAMPRMGRAMPRMGRNLPRMGWIDYNPRNNYFL
jgi:hypothetical protein